MAPSLQALIDFLLAEIALCGDQGASPSDILTFIDTFYKSQQDARSDTIDNNAPTQTIDRRFQEKVWSWLTRHPEVSVGKNKEGNHSTLADVEHHAETNETDINTTGPEETSQATPDNGEKGTKQIPDPHRPIRVFVSEERTWLAVAGHEPDETKVLPMEFALLSIIASRKSRGIVQTELVRLSGQDKRSVPKRTDMLQKKGYIEKRAIQIKPSRTSLCTLRRFVQETPVYHTTETPADEETATRHGVSNIIDIRVFIDKLFEIMREHKIIARDDLKRLLGFADHWRWKVLSRTTRKFERIGVLRRVRAKSQYSSKQLHACIMLVREPTERDLEIFCENSTSLFSKPGREEDNAQDEHEEELEPDNTTKDASSAADVEAVGAVKSEAVEDSGRTLPIWTPDRSMHNSLFDIIDSAGTFGMPNWEIMNTYFGGFFRRPLENALSRVVECWQLSQPPHLRHLAIVRDTAVRRTITHYIHYSARNFRRLVDAGQTSWEAVEFVPKDSKAANVVVPPVDVVPELDEYGLPPAIPANQLLKKGDATLLECLLVAKPADYLISSSDPVAVRLDDGRYAVRVLRQKPPNGTAQVLGHSIRTPKRQKQENLVDGVSNVEVDDIADEDNTMTITRPRKSKKDPNRFKGMSEKEILEALGLDETWTEYSVLLIDRPSPGVYITPRGRRRPAGKRQGRPRISRIAVFKSPKLTSLPWFVEEEADTATPLRLSKLDDTEAPIETPALEVPESSSKPMDSVSFQQGLVDEMPDAPLITPSRGQKRSHQDGDSVEPESVSRAALSRRMGGRPSKQRRLKESEAAAVNDMPTVETPKSDRPAQTDEQAPVADPLETAPASQPKRKRGKLSKPRKQAAVKAQKGAQESAADPAQPLPQEDNAVDNVPSSDETQEMPSKKRRRETDLREKTSVSAAPAVTINQPVGPVTAPAGDDTTEGPVQTAPPSIPRLAEDNPSTPVARAESSINTATAIATPSKTIPAIDRAPDSTPVVEDPTPQKPIAKPSEETQTQTPASDRGIAQTPETQNSGVRKKKMKDKGGSVAFLRRKIVMDIVEKAGGAFPMGTEIWYPFATAWMNMKHKEKPDLRTVRSTIKYLIDTGKLRQLTFSGKDSQGVMVTKSILTKPEIQPDDPLVRDMQKKMLWAGSRFYFPPNTERDPEIKKSRGRDHKSVLPFPEESNVIVRLQRKPAFVVNREKRKVRDVQRRLLRKLEAGAAETGDGERRRVVRLMKIRPASTPTAETPSPSNLTSISRPQRPSDEGKKRAAPRTQQGPVAPSQVAAKPLPRIGRMRRLLIPMAAYTMLINPKQTLHGPSGTFATDAGLGALCKPVLPREKRTAAAVAAAAATTTLPESLDDILTKTRRHEIDFSSKLDPRSSRFFSDNDTILRWELQSEALLRRKSTDLRYINQTVQDSFNAAPIEGKIRFDFDEPPRPPPPVIEPKVTRQAARRVLPEEIGPRYLPLPPLLKHAVDPALERPVDVPKPRRQPSATATAAAPQNRRLTKLNESMAALESDGLPAQVSSATKPIFRRSRPQNVPESLMKRIMIAIVVVRTLAGGLEGKMIDWGVVTNIFPGHDPGFIQDRGKFVLGKNRLHMAKMQSDFQDRFIEAYAKNQVPRIDYENLERYDWETVVDWAISQLDVPISTAKLPDLPATRAQFDGVFELREEALTAFDDMYQSTQNISVNRKRALFAGVPFAVPLRDKSSAITTRRKINNAELTRLEIAKTWVRANITTPEESYNPTEARKALDRFGEALVSNAVQSLVAERAISMGNRGRITPGRNYDITEHFLHTLSRRRFIENTQLRRAGRFKTNVLDPAFQTNRETEAGTGTHEIQYGAEDGDILAVINLVAEGKVILRPLDPPRNKFGLTDGGYLTRQMDKAKLRFGVEVRPVTGMYVFGNSVRERAALIPPPRYPNKSTGSNPDAMDIDIDPPHPHLYNTPNKIPIWFDIHGNFIKLLWDLVVAAVLGSVAIRPGISAAGIAGMLKPTMGAWEVQMLLEWMRDVGAVDVGVRYSQHAGDSAPEECPGWVVRDEWWLILG